MITRESAHEMARYALFSFVITFMAARACVFLIMSGAMPNLYFFLHGTHIHHLNYGIFLLAAVGGYSVFRRPEGWAARATALGYGLAMALTFDEFGMWLHLGGSYWQRASVDAVIVIAALFALVAFTKSFERLEAKHFWLGTILLVFLLGFGASLFVAGNRLGSTFGPHLAELEEASSP
jgi:hypothetical protein